MTDYDPVSLILLAYQEADTIEQEVRDFHEVVISRLPGSELIVAEDGSTDGTTEIIQRLSHELGVIHLSSPQRLGYRTAFINAVLSARQPYVFLSDTGLKHDPEDFWRLYPLRREYNLIVGRKTNRQDQCYRKLLTWGYNALLRAYFGIRGVYDADSGFRLFDREVVDRIFRGELIFSGFVNSEVVLRAIFAGLTYREVPVSYRQRSSVSRGLPPRVIPREILRVLGNLRRLKRELSGHSSTCRRICGSDAP